MQSRIEKSIDVIVIEIYSKVKLITRQVSNRPLIGLGLSKQTF